MVRNVLISDHCLDVALRFLIVVEGTTDVAYLECAATRFLQHSGVDLLGLDGGVGRITVCTPINPGDPERKRGGLPRVEKLADDLRQYALRFEIVGPVCFVLDHDETGKEKEQKIRKLGYTSDRAKVMTLDPTSHTGACRFSGKGDDPVVIEDLLSLSIQRRFFEFGKPSCEVVYEEGELTRIGWRKGSKEGLCEFVCTEAAWSDLVEVARILIRVRKMWRLDVPASLDALITEVSSGTSRALST